MPYPLENLRKHQPEIPTIPKGDKTALPVRGTAEELAVRHAVRVLRDVGEWLDAQPPTALALRPGRPRLLEDIRRACKSATRVINEGFEEHRHGDFLKTGTAVGPLSEAWRWPEHLDVQDRRPSGPTWRDNVEG
jgi:hypothetical protein